MFFRGTKLELACLLVLGLVVLSAVVGLNLPNTIAQAQTVTQETFVWPTMESATHMGNGVYYYRVLWGSSETFAKNLAAFKGVHPDIRISGMTAILGGSVIVNCERVGK